MLKMIVPPLKKFFLICMSSNFAICRRRMVDKILHFPGDISTDDSSVNIHLDEQKAFVQLKYFCFP